MPELQKIVTQINENLQGAFNLKGRPVKLYGIVELLPKDDDHSSPVLITGTEGEESVFDDRFVMTVYHRKQSISFEDQEGFGDEIARRETASMIAVCHCDPVKMKVDRHRLDSLFALKLGDQITVPYGDYEITASVSSTSINTQSTQVFAAEFPGYEYCVDTHHLFFSVQYTITSDYDASCLSVCAEC